MGSVGAEGLLVAKRARVLTAAQDEESSVIFGMPREALVMGAADVELSLDNMIPWIMRYAGRSLKPV